MEEDDPYRRTSLATMNHPARSAPSDDESFEKVKNPQASQKKSSSHRKHQQSSTSLTPKPAKRVKSTRNRRTGQLNDGQTLSLLDASSKDFYINKPVAFDINTELEKAIKNSFKVSFSSSSLTGSYLIGDVSRRSTTKTKAGQVAYDVCWRWSSYGVTPMSHSYISEGISAYAALTIDSSEKTASQKRSPRLYRDPFNRKGIKHITSHIQ